MPAVPVYQSRQIEGWTVQVREELFAEQKAATDEALTLLQHQLAEIVRAVPPKLTAKLREVTLWFSPEYPGVPPRAEYHPNRRWLVAEKRDPAMAKGVEFTNVRIFARETQRMPIFALHELAHACHDRVLGFDHAEIRAAFEMARSGGAYEHVERWQGDGRPNTFERAYAMTNEREYFAETTEAFLARNDFFPFTREELASHDPRMFELLKRIWNPAPD